MNRRLRSVLALFPLLPLFLGTSVLLFLSYSLLLAPLPFLLVPIALTDWSVF